MVPHIDNIITQFTTSGEWAGQADEGGICDPVVGGGGGGQMRRDIKERSHDDLVRKASVRKPRKTQIGL